VAVQFAAAPVVKWIFGTALGGLFGGGNSGPGFFSRGIGGILAQAQRQNAVPPPPSGASSAANPFPPAPQQRPSDPGYRPDITERRVPPLKRPPAPPKAPPAPNPNSYPSWRTFRANVYAITAVLIAQYGIEWVRRWLASDPAPGDPVYERAKAQVDQAAADLRGRRVFGKQAEAIDARARAADEKRKRDEIAAAEARGRAAERARVIAETPLEQIVITAKRVPMPKPPPPPPKTYLGLTRSQWLQVGGAAAPFLLGGSSTKRPKVLTTVQAPAAQFGPQSFVSFGGMGGTPTGTRTRECECPPKRKRERKPRTVCYSGTYTERASGLRKTKRRKVPCQ